MKEKEIYNLINSKAIIVENYVDVEDIKNEKFIKLYVLITEIEFLID